MIDDATIARIEAEHAHMAEHGGNPVAKQYGADRAAIIQRMRAAEQERDRLREMLAVAEKVCDG